jgi:hypothetical protein
MNTILVAIQIAMAVIDVHGAMNAPDSNPSVSMEWHL